MMNKIKNLSFIKDNYEKVSEYMGDPHRRLKSKNRIIALGLSILRFIIIGGLIFVIIFPLFQQISLALRAPGDLNNPTVVWIPENWTLLNLEIAGIMLDYSKAIVWSITLSIVIMLLQLFVASISGYAFARLRFKGSGVLFAIVLATIMIPPQTLSLNRYLFFQSFDIFGIFKFFFGGPLNLLSNELSWFAIISMSLLGMGINSGIFIFIFRQFFRGIPTELDESAEIDGASVIRTFWSVMLPNARPAMMTVGLFAFVWQYNDVYYARLLRLSSPARPLLSVRLADSMFRVYDALLYKGVLHIVGDKVTNNPFYLSMVSNTAAFLMMLPLLIMFVFLQRYFVEGIERTGIVG